jgi:hypothetical protein
MHNRQAITPPRLWKAICDYDLWPVSQNPLSKVFTYIANSYQDLCHWSSLLHPTLATWYLPNLEFKRPWI